MDVRYQLHLIVCFDVDVIGSKKAVGLQEEKKRIKLLVSPCSYRTGRSGWGNVRGKKKNGIGCVRRGKKTRKVIGGWMGCGCGNGVKENICHIGGVSLEEKVGCVDGEEGLKKEERWKGEEVERKEKQEGSLMCWGGKRANWEGEMHV